MLSKTLVSVPSQGRISHPELCRSRVEVAGPSGSAPFPFAWHPASLAQASAPDLRRVRVISHGSDSSSAIPATGGGEPASDAKPKGVLQRIKEFFVGDPNEKNKLAAIGMAAFLSYGFVSNVTYGCCLSFSWHAFMKAKGVCPLDPGQWPAFLGFYAGIWAVQNVFRPARFALAIAMAPAFDRGINAVATTLNVDKKVSFGVLLFLMAAVMTTGLFSSIYFFGGMPNGLWILPPLAK